MSDLFVGIGGGSGVTSDELTANASDVLKGKLYIGADTNDEAAEGTLELTGNAAANNVLSGKTFYNTNPKNKIAGTIPTYAGRTITPGTANQTIASGQYLGGNVIISGDSDLKAANIKKGVNIFGITGTFEGYVPSANDLYLRGNNIAGFIDNAAGSSNACRFESGAIYVRGYNTPTLRLYTTKTYNLSGYTKLNAEISACLYDSSDGAPDGYLAFRFVAGNDFTSTIAEYETYDFSSNYSSGTYWNHKTISINISNVNRTMAIGFWIYSFNIKQARNSTDYGFESGYPMQVYRIWLS